MASTSLETLPPEAELALAWSHPAVRERLRSGLQLDRRLARIVARTTEPMLGQMRLAWWRDALGTPVADRPRGDAVLDAIGHHWAGHETSLLEMVDAWEIMVTTPELGQDEAEAFARGRGAFFAHLGSGPAQAEVAPRLAAAGQCWALADAAAGVSDPAERSVLVTVGLQHSGTPRRMPREWRGVGALEALARRALRRGGRPLMDGRGAPLAALRGAILRL